MLPVATRRETLLHSAQTLLKENQLGPFTRPSGVRTSHQSSWETGFIALGYALSHPERAIQEIQHLFRGQWTNGMLPHIVFHSGKGEEDTLNLGFWQTESLPQGPKELPTSSLSFPPILGFVLSRIWRSAAKYPGMADLIQELWPKMVALHRFFYQERNPEGNGLVVIRHPWESGMANSPAWDTALTRFEASKVPISEFLKDGLPQVPWEKGLSPRELNYHLYLIDLFRRNQYDEAQIQTQNPFCVQDPLYNALLLRSNDELIALGNEFGFPTVELTTWSKQTREAINQKLWNSSTGLYHAKDLYTGELLPQKVVAGFMPMLAHVPDPGQAARMIQVLHSLSFHGNREKPAFFVPTYDLRAVDFDAETIGRGPVSVQQNWLLAQGLQAYGYLDLASQVKQQSLELISKNGFHSDFFPWQKGNFDSHKGIGSSQNSVTAALTIDWLGKNDI